MKHLRKELKLFLERKCISEEIYLKKDIREKLETLKDFEAQCIDHSETGVMKGKDLSMEFCKDGDKNFSSKDYSEALKKYNDAILHSHVIDNDEHVHTFFVKRSQCFVKQKLFREAAEDLKKAMENGCPSEAKLLLHEKMIKCYFLIGEEEKVVILTTN